MFIVIRGKILVLRWGPDLKLGQFPMPSQQVLVLIAEIIHGGPVLHVSLTEDSTSNVIPSHLPIWNMILSLQSPVSRLASKALPY